MKWLTLLAQLIAGMSPEVRAALKEGLDKMQANAAKTKLPFDDIGVMLLRAILGL